MWVKTLEDAGIPHVDFTMVTDVLTDGDRVVGAMGLHVPSGTVMQFNAAAVVMCTGGGCFKPTGFPVGGDTFDGEYIAYNLGLPIAGKEYDDFHSTCSYAAGNAFINNNWDYAENIWFCGGDITADNAASYGKSKFMAMVADRITKAMNGLAPADILSIEDQANGTVTRVGGQPRRPAPRQDGEPQAQGRRVRCGRGHVRAPLLRRVVRHGRPGGLHGHQRPVLRR